MVFWCFFLKIGLKEEGLSFFGIDIELQVLIVGRQVVIFVGCVMVVELFVNQVVVLQDKKVDGIGIYVKI